MNTLDPEVRIARVGEILYVRRWAAQSFASTYMYFRASQVALNRKGKPFLRPLKDRLYGCRGNGTLYNKLPPCEPFKLHGMEDSPYCKGYSMK